MSGAWDAAMRALEAALAEGRWADARREAGRALDAGRAFGRGGRLATPLYALAVAAARGGDLAEADAASGRALALALDLETEPPLAGILALRVAVLEARGDDDALLALFDEARVRVESARSRELLTARGLAEARRGRPEAAGRSLEAALVVAEAGAPPEALAEALFNAATHPAAGVDAAERERRLRRALAILPDAAGELAARARHNLGALLAEAGRPEDALEELSHAYRLLRARHGDAAPCLRPTLVRLADLHRAAGREVLAVGLYALAGALAEPGSAAARALSAELQGALA